MGGVIVISAVDCIFVWSKVLLDCVNGFHSPIKFNKNHLIGRNTYV